ncbi:MAG: bifunctional demethylmenaquinone methyltransferase/2-methoxy-6-polyprenyl-1,4-benzoquinol methylase UbiE [Gammaproteobacteria bacterium]|nr:bifunctional demethylmenaquinone methyltransferase/2-methoxy-6-polyprenyl-1,4-benzoquinol methylase UbiE [Gammaproteobacteria bacterium]
MDQDKKTTHFGYQQVPVDEKADKVRDVFSSVASKYDLMNDLMSFGLHRIWKHFAINICSLQSGQRVLDLAGGTGDLTARIIPKIAPNGEIILSDINAAMLAEGKKRLMDQGFCKEVSFVQANAECLPFADNYFDRIIIGFGLRNVTDKDKALRSMFRCLRPSGKLIVLEFSKPNSKLIESLYDRFSFKVLPWLGKKVANDTDSYRYLAESIRMHPDQNTLKSMLQQAGFESCEYNNLSGGIVAVHTGYKI